MFPEKRSHGGEEPKGRHMGEGKKEERKKDMRSWWRLENKDE